MHNRYLIIDVETTGLYVEKGDRIIEIAYIYLKKGKVKKIFNTLIKSNKKISKNSYLINKIKNSMLKNKPRFIDIHKKLLRLIKKCYLVIHNAKFDIKFLKKEFEIIKIKVKFIVIDTLRIFRKIFPGKKNTLKKISERIGIKNNNLFHRALYDAILLYKIFVYLLNKQSMIAKIS
ncbi:3'-5' exonuclease [Candidatus Vidania fulgoroideorum]